MCGISGIYRKREQPVRMDELKRMTNVIAHRGPDGVSSKFINPDYMKLILTELAKKISITAYSSGHLFVLNIDAEYF